MFGSCGVGKHTKAAGSIAAPANHLTFPANEQASSVEGRWCRGLPVDTRSERHSRRGAPGPPPKRPGERAEVAVAEQVSDASERGRCRNWGLAAGAGCQTVNDEIASFGMPAAFISCNS